MSCSRQPFRRLVRWRGGDGERPARQRREEGVFTGLVESTGRIERLVRKSGAGVLRISAPFADQLIQGESVAVDGVCLTVSRILPGAFECEAVERTLTLTTLGRRTSGASVNLERALEIGDRLGGHVVTGHVDGIGTIAGVAPTANARDVVIEIPGELVRYVAERGSIAVDGISLTVAVLEDERVTVSLIPETLTATISGGYARGTRVNIETDVMAKYQESLRRAEGDESVSKSAITIQRLRELGFTE